MAQALLQFWVLAATIYLVLPLLMTNLTSPLACLAWEALTVAYATTSIALGIIRPHNPHHYTEVGIPLGGTFL